MFFVVPRRSRSSLEGVKRLNCDWVAEKRERCTESGIVMEEFEESEDDEDPNKLLGVLPSDSTTQKEE